MATERNGYKCPQSGWLADNGVAAWVRASEPALVDDPVIFAMLHALGSSSCDVNSTDTSSSASAGRDSEPLRPRETLYPFCRAG